LIFFFVRKWLASRKPALENSNYDGVNTYEPYFHEMSATKGTGKERVELDGSNLQAQELSGVGMSS
jgi:hypothetical protein